MFNLHLITDPLISVYSSYRSNFLWQKLQALF
jgi:hypothetical protein